MHLHGAQQNAHHHVAKMQSRSTQSQSWPSNRTQPWCGPTGARIRRPAMAVVRGTLHRTGDVATSSREQRFRTRPKGWTPTRWFEGARQTHCVRLLVQVLEMALTSRCAVAEALDRCPRICNVRPCTRRNRAAGGELVREHQVPHTCSDAAAAMQCAQVAVHVVVGRTVVTAGTLALDLVDRGLEQDMAPVATAQVWLVFFGLRMRMNRSRRSGSKFVLVHVILRLVQAARHKQSLRRPPSSNRWGPCTCTRLNRTLITAWQRCTRGRPSRSRGRRIEPGTFRTCSARWPGL